MIESGTQWVTEDQKQKIEAVLEQEEGIIRKLGGRWSLFITVTAVLMSLFHLYAAVGTVTTQVLRGIHVGFVLLLVFLVHPPSKKLKGRISWIDILLSLLGVATILYMLIDFEGFIYRAVTPTLWDKVFGIVLILLIFEAARRTTGWIMPITVALFLLYAFFGYILPAPWTHRGYDLDRIIGHMYMTLEGIFGVPIDVSATFIILFTIYGAFLDASGAGKFFIDFSFAAMGKKPAGAGRTVTLASFLLGGPSGSGVATTVTIGSVAYPMLSKAGYDKESAGGLLSAGGIGAVISPPVLGAAAFLIAEFLKISYLDVIKMACIPTLLYYWGLFLMVEFDAKRFGIKMVAIDETYSLKVLTLRYGFHFFSLIGIVVLMLVGFTPIWAVFWAIIITFLFSFIRKDTALMPQKLIKALKDGSTGVLGIAATCAAAGIIVGVVSLTGIGLKFSSIIIDLAGGNLLVTAMFTAVLLWIIGLAVPITATYIIAAVIAAPALTKLGVPDFAAHMFIFYYAVLSEVSPPTALSPFAAAALTGGNPFKTTLMAWKYTIPAFLVPFMFVIHPSGAALLLIGSHFFNILQVVVTSFIGIFAISAGASGWFLKRTNLWERLLLIASGLSLVYPSAFGDLLGIGLLLLAALSQKVFRKGDDEPQAALA